jgi:anti-sigma factor RsiW
MSDCSRIDALVTPFVDGELSDADSALVTTHIERCPPCHAKVSCERSVRGLLDDRRGHLRGCAPQQLKARCAALAGASRAATVAPFAPRPRVAPSWTTRLRPLALAASLLLVIGTLVFLSTRQSTRVLAAELAVDHEKCFTLNKVLATQHSAAAVQAAMSSRFGWPMEVPDLSNHQDVSVVGSRPCLYGEGVAAHLMFTHNGEPVSLFMLPGESRPEQVVEVMGHQCRIWSRGNRTFVLVARGSRVPLDDMATLFAASFR